MYIIIKPEKQRLTQHKTDEEVKNFLMKNLLEK
jgi:hypothetical protein